ncbi:RIIa domain-containing protein 1 [Falco rusticolus]|uniref:RIIa domain-containing protein 1 n=1 Tax=Falco rusticolus TaxID=120794 RepID=UPI0018869261|nr:RIIa domain-containing protein 1 [Falco rusticolus]
MASPQPPRRPAQATLRLSSERYLRAQPTLRPLLGGFLRELLRQRPDDVLEFATGEWGALRGPHGTGGGTHSPLCAPPTAYFSQPGLPGRIQEELRGGQRGWGTGSHPDNRQ